MHRGAIQERSRIIGLAGLLALSTSYFCAAQIAAADAEVKARKAIAARVALPPDGSEPAPETPPPGVQLQAARFALRPDFQSDSGWSAMERSLRLGAALAACEVQEVPDPSPALGDYGGCRDWPLIPSASPLLSAILPNGPPAGGLA